MEVRFQDFRRRLLELFNFDENSVETAETLSSGCGMVKSAVFKVSENYFLNMIGLINS